MEPIGSNSQISPVLGSGTSAKRLTLRTLFVLVVGIPLLLLAAALFVYAFYASREETSQQMKTLIETEAVSHAKTLYRYLILSMSGPDYVARSLSVREPQNVDEMLHLQYAMLAGCPIIYGNVIAWEPFAFNPKEKYCCPYVWREEQNKLNYKMFSPETEYDYLSGEWDWYENVRKKYAESADVKHTLDFSSSKLKESDYVRVESGLWSKPYFDDGGGNVLMTTYSAPFFRQGKFAGVVTSDIATDWINNFLSENVIKGAYFILCDTEGNLISYPDSNLIMKDIGDIVREKHLKNWYKPLKIMENLAAAYELVPAQLDENDESYNLKCIAELSCEAENLMHANKKMQLAVVQVPAAGWFLIYSVPVESIYSEVNARFWNISVLFFIILPFLFVYVYWFFNRQVVAPVQNLIAAAREVSGGNFDYRIAVSVLDGRELQELEENFNQMSAALRKSVEEQVQFAAEKELLEASNRAKGDILMLAGHELRTPLTGSIGATDLLLQTELTPKQREYVDLQKESNTSLLFLINNILDYSKLSAIDKTELQEKIFSLHEAVTSSFHSQQLLANSKNLTFRTEYGSDVPNSVFGDDLRIRQVLSNLLGNAVKFSKDSEILVKITAEGNLNVGKKQILFEVIDSGIGVSPELREQLFEPPKQENISTRRFDGMGLGLTISNSIVKNLGGKIGHRETPGGGSTFWFSLPLSDAGIDGESLTTMSQTLANEYNLVHNLPTGRTYRILVAEDNRINRIVIKEMLTKAEYEVAMAEDGRKAVEAWQSAEQPFDLIIMDLQMPDVDGYEAAEQIRRIENKNNVQTPIPIIALTANAAPQDKERCLEIGMNAYHNKPIDAPDLLRTLRHCIKRKLRRENNIESL